MLKQKWSRIVKFLLLACIVMPGLAAPGGELQASYRAAPAEVAGREWASGQGLMHTAVGNALQENDAVVYERYDVHIELQSDGSFHVREEQEIVFNEAFRTAFAEIPLDYVTEIENIQVSASGEPYRLVSGQAVQPGTYSVSREPDAVFVDWAYEETTPGETRTFELAYDVIGGLWVYDDGDILEWRAVPADRSGVPVRSSVVTITLPEAVPPAQIQTNAFGPPYAVTVTERQISFTSEGEVPNGTAFQVMVGFPHGVVEASVQPWQRRADSAELVYHVPSVEVALDIADDGVVRVTERQTVAVDAGVLYGGQRSIPLAFVDELLNFSLAEGEALYALYNERNATCEACAWVEQRGASGDWIWLNRGMGTMTIDEEAAGEVHIGWTAPPLVKGEETTFVLSYTALGALQIGDEAQVLAWTPISDFDVEVGAARVTVDPPSGVSAQEIEVESGAVQTTQDGRLLIAHDGALAPGERWQIRLRLPPNATSATKPAWQQEMEAVALEAETIQEALRQEEMRRARLQLAFGVLGGLLLVGGLLAAGLFWYLWGRDTESLPIPSYLSEPPSDLPPGIVAYLLDEKPTPKGVLASLFHLATLGLLRIDLSDPLRLARNYEGELVEGQTIETVDGEMLVIPKHMVRLFNGLRPVLDTALTPLTQITSHFPRIIPAVYVAMGEEANNFFDHLPEVTRRRWLVYGQWIVLGGVGLALAAAIFFVSSLGWIAVAPALALVVSGVALILVSRWMPRRSDAGALEAARWRAFERYLRELKTYGGQEDAQRILERHFAYAVALDVEDIVLSQAAQMEARMPTWTRRTVLYGPPQMPAPPPRASRSPMPGPLRRGPLTTSDRTRETGEVVGDPAPGDAGSLSLEGLAESLASRLERANESLTGTLRQAVGDVSHTPFQMVWRGAGKLTTTAAKTSLEIMEQILEEAASGGGSSSYRGSLGGSRRSSSSWGSGRSSSFSGRSSSSRRSGGGGRRGFGR